MAELSDYKKYIIGFVVAAIITIAGYIWYANKQIKKYSTCCQQKTVKENTLVIENAKLDSLLLRKDTVFLPIVSKAKDLKTKSNAIKTMVIITEPDSIIRSLTRLTDNKKQGK